MLKYKIIFVAQSNQKVSLKTNFMEKYRKKFFSNYYYYKRDKKNSCI